MPQRHVQWLSLGLLIVSVLTLLSGCTNSVTSTTRHISTATQVATKPCATPPHATAPILSTSPQVLQLSSDSFTVGPAIHATEVEPSSFACGEVIVSTFQIGRLRDGGSDAIGWASSQDNGATWHHGILPNLTKLTDGVFDRISDPSVTYDAAHSVWLASSLALYNTPGKMNPVNPVGIVVNRSLDNGLTWSTPITVYHNDTAIPDKDWIRCDNTPASPYYGHCYDAWHDNSHMQMSTSTDGGETWSPNQETTDKVNGIDGIPLTEPNGLVIVPFVQYLPPIASSPGPNSHISAFISRDGGASWGETTQINQSSSQNALDLLEADEDNTGRIVVVWGSLGDKGNLMATSTDGQTWSVPTSLPIGSHSDVLAIGIDPATSGVTAHMMALAQVWDDKLTHIKIVAITSIDGGATWSVPVTLASMSLGWVVAGKALGDYLTVSFAGGRAHPIFPIGLAPKGTTLNEAMYTVSG